MKILIVEDEVRLADTLGQIMLEQKYNVDIVHDGISGLEYIWSGQYDVVVLDVMLPGKNGFDIVKEVRAAKVHTPILLLTARDETLDKITGLDCGADDYMTKPFVPEELLARIRALARRQGEVILEELTYADLTLHLASYTLSRKEKSIHLGFKEFEIMKLLMSNPNMIHSKDSIISKVWGQESDAEDNNVEAYISFLRKKFFYLESCVSIGVVRRVGYRLECQEEAS